MLPNRAMYHIFHLSSYSETSLLGFPKTSNDAIIFLKQQRLTYPKHPIIGHLNISSFRNNFRNFKDLILNKTDGSLISGRKPDNIFPSA